MKIALLCPSRGRPQRFADMAHSALWTASYPDRVMLYLTADCDDPKFDEYLKLPPHRTVWHPNMVPGRKVPELLNELARRADEDILFAVSDDILFRTQGWDDILQAAFERYPDGLLVAYTNDGLDRDKCLHFAVSQRWLKFTGDLIWPGFEHFYGDEWVETLGRAIGRTVFLRDLVTEHMHYKYGKAPNDATYSAKRGNGMSRRDGQRMQEQLPEIERIAERMRAAMVAA